jgi:TonB family protein
MAHFPIPQPDPDPKAADPAVSASGRLTEIPGGRRSEALSFESDLAGLAAKFSSEEGGNLSAELSADLALEVVLNEIVEQACFATGASGASVILERAGEWVCRATSGPSAPQLGERLGREAGLIAECIRTRQIQRCKNSETDGRTEIDAYRSRGVRSVIVLPLFQNGSLVGVFAAFALQAFDFRAPEERTLEALCGYVLSSLAQAAEPIQLREAAAIENIPPIPESQDKGSSAQRIADKTNGLKATEKRIDAAAATDDGEERLAEFGGTENRTINIATWVLTALVLAAAALLTTVASERLIGKKASIRTDQRHAPGIVAPTEGAAPEGTTTAAAGLGRTEVASAPISLPSRTDSRGSAATGAARVARGQKSSDEDGSLTVYEDGKEVFHLPPGARGPVPQTQGSRVNGGTMQAPAIHKQVNTAPSSGVEGSIMLRVEPEYPEEALQQKIEGAVVLDLWVGRDGAVQQVKVVSGAPVLAGAAVAAVKQWQFNPHVINGEPAEMRSRVTLNFTLPH